MDATNNSKETGNIRGPIPYIIVYIYRNGCPTVPQPNLPFVCRLRTGLMHASQRAYAQQKDWVGKIVRGRRGGWRILHGIDKCMFTRTLFGKTTIAILTLPPNHMRFTKKMQEFTLGEVLRVRVIKTNHMTYNCLSHPIRPP